MMLLLFTASRVSAGWTGSDYDIADIFSDVGTVNNNLTGKIPNTVLYDFTQQRKAWLPYKGNTPLLADGIQDILDSLPALRSEFLDFIDADGVDSPDKCNYRSDCYAFRNDLVELFSGLNELKSKFPVFEKAGLADTDLARKAIYETPPIILFGMYKVMNRQPVWKKLPSDLNDIFDELDDPEIFSIDLVDNDSAAVNASLLASTSASNVPAISDSTKTQRFCARRADKFDGVGRGLNGNRDGWDQIRVNRIILVVTLYSDVFKWMLGLVPDDIDIGAAILGEGATLGIPSALWDYVFKAVPLAMDSILKAIDVYHKNIGLCKARFAEIEGRLSSCAYYPEFAINQTVQGEYYALVNRRFAMADEAGVSHNKSDNLMTKSLNKLNNQNYNKAFKLLCDSYSSIGIKN
jgi:hypothetical protein